MIIAKSTENDQESPIVRAHRLSRSPYLKARSCTYQKHVRRVVSKIQDKTPMFALLDREAAPFFACRWIAWGKWHQDRTLRMVVAFLLRREVDTLSGWVWANERRSATAEKLFRSTPQYERLVRAGIFLPAKRLPTPEETTAHIVGWQRAWDMIQHELLSLDQATFAETVDRATPARKRRYRPKLSPPTEKELEVIEATQVIQKAAVMVQKALASGVLKIDPASGQMALTEKQTRIRNTPRKSSIPSTSLQRANKTRNHHAHPHR